METVSFPTADWKATSTATECLTGRISPSSSPHGADHQPPQSTSGSKPLIDGRMVWIRAFTQNTESRTPEKYGAAQSLAVRSIDRDRADFARNEMPVVFSNCSISSTVDHMTPMKNTGAPTTTRIVLRLGSNCLKYNVTRRRIPPTNASETRNEQIPTQTASAVGRRLLVLSIRSNLTLSVFVRSIAAW